MAKQDDYTRYTVRIPTPLYNRLKEAAGEASVNAEIVHRLQTTFDMSPSGVVEAVGVAKGSSSAKAEGAASRLTEEEKEDLWQWMLKRRDKNESPK